MRGRIFGPRSSPGDLWSCAVYTLGVEPRLIGQVNDKIAARLAVVSSVHGPENRAERRRPTGSRWRPAYP
eukprot:1775854-Prymnesium_polylepis.3